MDDRLRADREVRPRQDPAYSATRLPLPGSPEREPVSAILWLRDRTIAVADSPGIDAGPVTQAETPTTSERAYARLHSEPHGHGAAETAERRSVMAE